MATNRQILESIIANATSLLEMTEEQLDNSTGRGELAEIDDKLDSILSICQDE